MEILSFIFTIIASTQTFIICCLLIALFLLKQKKTREAVFFISSALGLAVSVVFFKELFHIPRPEGIDIYTTGYAFPSGHSAGIIFLGIIIPFLTRHTATTIRYAVLILSILSVIAVGISRVYFNAHTPIQVIAGYALGALWAGIFVGIIHRRVGRLKHSVK